MIEKTLTIETPDGSMESFVAHPEDGEHGAGPFPVVVLYMDAPGIREELHDFVRRLAREGYYALVPDLYYRRGRVRLDMTAKGARQVMVAHMNSLSNAGVVSDTRALLAALEAEPAAAGGPVGCIGHCMSGQFVVTVAGTFPERFRASVSCYGVRIVTDADDSPHHLLKHAQGELFFAFAEKDEHVPEGVIPTLRDALETQGVAHQLEIYPGTEHGFCFPERRWCYDAEAAEDVWARSFALFERQLRAA